MTRLGVDVSLSFSADDSLWWWSDLGRTAALPSLGTQPPTLRREQLGIPSLDCLPTFSKKFE